jgi:peroxiredoxin Q/BCP
MPASLINQPAPDFLLPDHEGNMFQLHGQTGTHALVLFFYPKDHSDGCTAEACAFRDAYEDFSDAGAKVVGISRDSVESHAGFRKAHRLGFPLLSDPDGRVAQLFGVNHSLFRLLPGRVTFVVDKNGIIRKIFDSQLKFKKHMQEA